MTKAPGSKKAMGKWNQFMGNGKAEPVSNGGPSIKLSTLRATPEDVADEGVELHETRFLTDPHQVPPGGQQDYSGLLHTLMDIKQNIKNEVSALDSKMNRLDSQIETIITAVTASPAQWNSTPPPASLRIESDYFIDSGKSSSETRSMSPDSNSSASGLKPHKRTNKLQKTSKVSPQPPSIPQLHNAGSSPTKSKSIQRHHSTSAAQKSENTVLQRRQSSVSTTATSRVTLDTTVESVEAEPPSLNNLQRKTKMSNLDML